MYRCHNHVAIGLAVAVVWTGAGQTWAQQAPQRRVRNNFADPDVRARVVEELLLESRTAKVEAVEFARRHNLPIRGDSERGVYELMRIENGLPIYFHTLDVNAGITTGANLLHTIPYDLSGADLTVGIWDGGAVLATHQEFGNRVSVLDAGAIHYHATGVAGTVGAAGVDPWALGMAPSVYLDSYDWNDDLAEMASRGASYPGEPGTIYVSNHSYGIMGGWMWTDLSGTIAWHWYYPNGHKIFGVYYTWTRDWDQTCYDAPYYLPFIGSGNERDDNPTLGDLYYDYLFGHWYGPYPYDPETDAPGDGIYKDGYDTIAPYGIAKNVMTVGAVSAAVFEGMRDPSVASMTDFSSWGPADDGRIKPDIVGDGVDVYHPYSADDESYATWGGTSSSTPNASGSAILLVEHYTTLFPGNAMRASTLKALILHTADDLGNPGPDYVYGWGLMNVHAAAEQIQKHHDYPGQHRIVEGLLTDADPVHSYQFVSEGADPIRVTVCWTDPPGVPTDVSDDPTPKLVNDLNLRLLGPGGAPMFYPYVLDMANPSNPATTGNNYVDNVEQVYLPAPPGAGTYTVEVRYEGTLTDGEQAYSLVVSGQGPGPAGTVALDNDGYKCADTVEIEVTDADLWNNGTQDVAVTTSGGDSETVTLMETPAGSAVFVGSIGTSSDPIGIEDGTLQVGDAETITGTYNDADDGTGSPAVMLDTAAVDCILPVISNVTTTNITAAGARVAFDTNETASVQVWYGPTCDNLIETNAGFVVGATHQVVLSGLLSETAYFYAVAATDAAGNTATEDNGGACYSFTTLVWVDYFTEGFNRVDNDLDYQTLTLTPDGSGDFYQACRDPATAFPTDPAGGTVFSFGLDDYAQVTLSGGAQVSLYGTSYSSFYVGSNGYITFTQGDTDYSESLADHFDSARISGVFDDFNLPAGGSVSWKQLADRAVVTYENVPEWHLGGGTGSNSFQVEMFFDERIRITWLEIDARDGLSGLSAGNGKPSGFLESDLSGYDWCSPPADCNDNGIPDDIDISDGTSDDCSNNDVPDECEIEENSTAPGGPFYCDPAAPPVGLDECNPDCNDNGIPDECDVPPICPACPDCNANGIPDACEPDCQPNGVPDDCDITSGTSQDCNLDGVPDECVGCADDCECENGQFCDGSETCESGVCTDQGDPCIDLAHCDETDDRCLECLSAGECDDGLWCTGPETCIDFACQAGTDACPGLVCAEVSDICLSPVDLPLDPRHQAAKHRYLSINPSTNAPNEVAIKVQVAEMRRCAVDPRRACLVNADCDPVCANDLDKYCESPAQCGGADCVETGPCDDVTPDPPLSWIVQQPMQEPEGSGCKRPGCDPANPPDPPGNCCTDEDWVARLSDTVYSEDWSAYTVLHIGDCPIVPCVTYNVYACDPLNLDVCSEPLEVATQRFPALFPFKLYGDVAGGTVMPGPEVLPPDGYVNVADLQVTVFTILYYGTVNKPQAHPTWVDLHGPGVGIPPQYILNVSDLTAVYVFGLTDGLPWVNTQGGVDPQDCP